MVQRTIEVLYQSISLALHLFPLFILRVEMEALFVPNLSAKFNQVLTTQLDVLLVLAPWRAEE